MEINAEINFTKIREIGAGQGMNSKVYLAFDPQLDTNLAIKEIDKASFWNDQYFSEAQIVFSVAHSNVVPVQYGCEQQKLAYIAMPYYDKGSLASRLQQGCLGISESLRVIHPVLQGLAHIHIKGRLHLDIKPSNILMRDDSVPLIADFGQARSVGPHGIVSAPPMYAKTLPPEVLCTGRAAVQSDVYLAGLLFYRMLNGESQFNSQRQAYESDEDFVNAVIKGKFPNRNSFLPHVPDCLRRIVRKALRVNVAERFESASDMSDALSRTNISRDWTMQVLPTGDCEWTGKCDNKADLQVNLIKLPQGWDTRVYTKTSKERAFGRSANWRVFATRAEAVTHLTAVFSRLT